MMRVITRAENGWGVEPLREILAADARERVANLSTLGLGETVKCNIVSDGHAFQQTRDGVGRAAVGPTIGFGPPPAASGESPLPRGFAITRVAAEGIGKRQMLGDRKVAHDGVEAVVKILVARVGRDWGNPFFARFARETPIGGDFKVAPNERARAGEARGTEGGKIVCREVKTRVAGVREVCPRGVGNAKAQHCEPNRESHANHIKNQRDAAAVRLAMVSRSTIAARSPACFTKSQTSSMALNSGSFG